jgi:hypothetical protein
VWTPQPRRTQLRLGALLRGPWSASFGPRAPLAPRLSGSRGSPPCQPLCVSCPLPLPDSVRFGLLIATKPRTSGGFGGLASPWGGGGSSSVSRWVFRFGFKSSCCFALVKAILVILVAPTGCDRGLSHVPARRDQCVYVLPCYRARLSRERARPLVRCYQLGQASALMFQIFMGVAPYKRVKKPSCETWPCRHRSYTNRTQAPRNALASLEPRKTSPFPRPALRLPCCN